ncbi:type IV secretion system DNA-binding domain-containing protein [Acidisoma sp. S159]|uniref:type IV secretion system DNA-binding domain-containing protein n=1 Tax=Acidisoma sp. S159 TaxID=1747225 RepID=UPI00131DB137|nr:type IV secretion system DNA-binding domain-containing protein [Acidisoma sp. S159]
MKTKNNDEPLIFAMSLAAGLAVIGLTWHYVMVSVMPPQVRMNMWNLTQEAWSYRDNFSAYLVWRFPPMVAEGYPFAFMAAVLPGVLVYGGIVAARHRHWISLAQAAAGWLAGGIVGFFLMAWVPMPNILLTVFAMPGLAFLAGSLAPVLLAPVQDRSVVRGTRVRRHFSNTLKTIQAAEKSGRTVLAGMMLDPAAETQHLVTIGVTGSGKSVALLALMHTAMHRGDRHIVADPDGSAMRLFYREGDVILNPADARSAKWDILAEITEDSDYRFLAESVLPYPKGDEDNEWVTYAQEIFAACLQTWHEHRLGTSDAFFEAMATADKEKLATLCEGTAAHRYFEGGNEKMFGSVMGTLAPALGGMRQLARVQGPSFSVRRWMREGKGSLWMPYRAQQIPALRGLISCWMGLAISEGLSFEDSLSRRMWFHIDELDALGRIQGLKDAMARIRKKGGCIAMGIQSIAQVRAVYGEAEAHTIVENCDNKLILRCGASEGGGTAKFASQVIGEHQVERDETTTSRTQGKHASTSTSQAVRIYREPAVMDSEIMRLASCNGYLKTATNPDWSQVAFKPVEFPARVKAYVPVATRHRDAAE